MIASLKADEPSLRQAIGAYPKQGEIEQITKRLNEIHKELAGQEKEAIEQMEKEKGTEVRKAADAGFPVRATRHLRPIAKSLSDGQTPHPLQSRLSLGEVPGLHGAVSGLGARHYGSMHDGSATTHQFAAQNGRAALGGIKAHMSRLGYHVMDTPAFSQHTLRSTDSPVRAHLKTHTFTAVHPVTGETHHFQVEERPWLAAAPAQRQRTPKAARPVQAPATKPKEQGVGGKVLAILTRGFGKSPFPKAGRISREQASSPHTSYMRGIASQYRGMNHVGTWSRTLNAGKTDETRHFSHLVTHKNPSVASQKLYSHVADIGHNVTPMSYSRVRHNGVLHHRYTFEFEHEGNRHKVTVMRPESQVKPTLKPVMA